MKQEQEVMGSSGASPSAHVGEPTATEAAYDLVERLDCLTGSTLPSVTLTMDEVRSLVAHVYALEDQVLDLSQETAHLLEFVHAGHPATSAEWDKRVSETARAIG